MMKITLGNRTITKLGVTRNTEQLESDRFLEIIRTRSNVISYSKNKFLAKEPLLFSVNFCDVIILLLKHYFQVPSNPDWSNAFRLIHLYNISDDSCCH